MAPGRDANSTEIYRLHPTNDVPSTGHESSHGERYNMLLQTAVLVLHVM